MDPQTLSELKLVLRATHADALSYVLNKQPTISTPTAWYFEPYSTRTSACLVAHLDTVWDRDRTRWPSRLYHDTIHDVLWSPDGLGADDRAGLVAVFQIRAKTGCAVLICDGEESGGIGATDATRHARMSQALQRHRFLVELDRQGARHFVCYSNEPSRFRRLVKATTGYAEQSGSFSDVAILSRSLRIPACNLATGYRYEHSTREMLTLAHWTDALRAATALVCCSPPASFGDWQSRRSRRYEWDREEWEDIYGPEHTYRLDQCQPRRGRRSNLSLWDRFNRQPPAHVDSKSSRRLS